MENIFIILLYYDIFAKSVLLVDGCKKGE